MKKTKDQDWINRHGTEDIDIANTSYGELPEDWKGKNKISAEVAISQVYVAISQQKELNDSFIENASSVIHDKWLERNKDLTPTEQYRPYSELSEEEKDKDRTIIKKAIKVYNDAK